MSVSLTEGQVRDRTKTVTRRAGWLMLRVGDQLTLCRKVRGRRPGEELDRIVTVEVTAVRRERLDAITAADVAAEGFPEMTPAEFVSFFCGTHRGCGPADEVTRIEWRYLDGPVFPGSHPVHGVGRPETGTSPHPMASGIERIQAILHRPADGTGEILALRDRPDRPARHV